MSLLVPPARLAALIASGSADEGFALLYGKEAIVGQRQRYLGLLDRSGSLLGNHSVCFVSAPGRTEIGGNHTDHQGGRVLTAAIDQDCVGLVGSGDGKAIDIVSDLLPKRLRVDLDQLQPKAGEEGHAISLVRGVAAFLPKHTGGISGSFSAIVNATCRPGTGLSSSASFAVFVGTSSHLLATGDLADPVAVAKVAQQAENLYFGKPCGMMDQLASSCGGTLAIDFTRRDTPELHQLNASLEDHGYRLLMVDTGGSHADLTPEYAAIPEEMQAAAAVLGAARGRDTTVAQLLAHLDEVRRQAGDRATLRLIHFLTEDRRVEAQTTALEEGRFTDFLQLVRGSGESSMALLQNCASSIDSREQGVLLGLALARQLYPESVCRVHGGGFAGTIQCYVPAARTESFVSDMEGIFGPGNCWPVRTGRPGACALGGDGWVFRQGRLS